MKPSGRGTRAAFFLFATMVTVFSLACGGLSPSRPPNLTPLPITDLRVVELGTDVLISDSSNGEAVGTGEDGEVYLVTVATGEKRQLTNDGHHKWNAVIAADYVAWLDQRRQLALPGSTSRTPLYADDVFLLDRRTGEVRRITDAPASRSGLRISGSRLVWRSGRKEGGDGQWEYDIYAFDIASGKELPVAMATDGHQWPAIQGDTVVWADNRNSPLQGNRQVGLLQLRRQSLRHLCLRHHHRGRDTAFRLGALQRGPVHPRPIRCMAGVLRRRQVAHTPVGPRHRTAAHAR